MNRKLAGELLFMFVLTTICTLVLVISEEFYQRKMAADPLVIRKIFEMLPKLAPPDAKTDPVGAFKKAFKTVKSGEFAGEVYVGLEQHAIVVRKENGSGLWGPVSILVAADAAKGRVLAIAVLEHSETPGLGSRIEEPPFCNQFIGLPAVKGRVRLAKIKSRENEFDGISGATRSSEAVERIVNSALNIMFKVYAQEKGSAPAVPQPVSGGLQK